MRGPNQEYDQEPSCWDGERTYCLLATLATSDLSVRAVVAAALLLLVVDVGGDGGERWVSLAVVVTK